MRSGTGRAYALAFAALGAVGLAATGCRDEKRLPHQRAVVPRGGESAPVRVSTLSAGVHYPLAKIENPFDGNVHALQEGRQLYLWFNCAGCHGAIGGGAIGPPLRDKDWIYGSDSLHIYRSIVEGRPNGMPAYRGVPEDSLWKIVAFVRSFGGVPDEQDAAPAREALRAGDPHEPHGGLGDAEHPAVEGNPDDPQVAREEQTVPPAGAAGAVGEATARRRPAPPYVESQDAGN
jgi:cytochrome c oxidase cbb3-type subunit III